jgi:hypothetical protein
MKSSLDKSVCVNYSYDIALWSTNNGIARGVKIRPRKTSFGARAGMIHQTDRQTEVNEMKIKTYNNSSLVF